MSARGLNWPLWSGFLLSPIAFLSYPFVFERWPVTRDVPWVNLMLFGLAALLLATGLRRAFAPGRMRWLRITSGLIATTLSVAIFANFAMSVFVHARHLPAVRSRAAGRRASPRLHAARRERRTHPACRVALTHAGSGSACIEGCAPRVLDVRGLPGVQFRVSGNSAAPR